MSFPLDGLCVVDREDREQWPIEDFIGGGGGLGVSSLPRHGLGTALSNAFTIGTLTFR